MSDTHWDRNLSLKITLQESKPRLVNYWKASFRLFRKTMAFFLGSRVIAEIGLSAATNKLPSISMGGLP